jgi:protoporphyrinogen oxidase
VENGRVVSVDCKRADGVIVNVPCDYLMSTMPLKDLVAAIQGIEVPADVKRIASELPYRDFITVGLLLDKMKLKNETKIKTYANRVPDTWIYIQERDVKVGRLQLFNNWSPYMVKDYENTMFVGLEYFCNEGDELWCMNDEQFIAMAIDELVKIDIIDSDAVLDATRVKIKKAYPAYFDTYDDMDQLVDYLSGIENLYCVGRNGQHRYNNIDHSMCTSFETVKNILSGETNKDNIWNVNTEKEYHEEKQDNER